MLDWGSAEQERSVLGYYVEVGKMRKKSSARKSTVKIPPDRLNAKYAIAATVRSATEKYA